MSIYDGIKSEFSRGALRTMCLARTEACCLCLFALLGVARAQTWNLALKAPARELVPLRAPSLMRASTEQSPRPAPKELIPQLSSISSLMHSTSKDAAEDFYEKLRRQTYMTPTSYLELIGLFIDLVGKKRGELTTKLNRYTVGSKTLSETQVVVDELKIMLTKMQPEIEQAKKDTAALMIKVEADQAVAKDYY